YFRTGTKVVRIKKDGTGRSDVFTSKDLVHAFTDGTTLVTVESPNPPNAAIRVAALGQNPNDAPRIDTDFVAASTNVFGSDATSLYAVGETDGGDNIYKVAKTDAGGVNTLVETQG